MNLDGSVKRAKKKCCVPGCGNTEGRFFRFPNPKKGVDLLKAWLLAINSPRLFEIPFDKLFQSSLLCARHFNVDDFQHGTRRGLKWNVVPKFFLPVANGKDSGEKNSTIISIKIFRRKRQVQVFYITVFLLQRLTKLHLFLGRRVPLRDYLG